MTTFARRAFYNTYSVSADNEYYRDDHKLICHRELFTPKKYINKRSILISERLFHKTISFKLHENSTVATEFLRDKKIKIDVNLRYEIYTTLCDGLVCYMIYDIDENNLKHGYHYILLVDNRSIIIIPRIEIYDHGKLVYSCETNAKLDYDLHIHYHELDKLIIEYNYMLNKRMEIINKWVDIESKLIDNDHDERVLFMLENTDLLSVDNTITLPKLLYLIR